MQIRRLLVSGFRNLEPQEIRFPKRITVINGSNGQGKTSIIEAVYLLAHRRSFRPGKLSDLVSWRSEIGAEVNAAIVNAELTFDFGYTITQGHREVYCNGKPVTSAQKFYGTVRVVEFTPSDLELVSGGPAVRRQFFDRLLAMTDDSYVEQFVQYQRALKHRNKLLQSGNAESLKRSLSAWNNLLASSGVKLTRKRDEAVKFFESEMPKIYHEITGGDVKERPTISYRAAFCNESGVVSEDEAIGKLQDSFERDLFLRSTTVGIHRDDIALGLDFGFGNQPARESASQGQARSLAFTLKIAAVDYVKSVTGEEPILLLDDVESELDQFRRRGLERLIKSRSTQVILTTVGLRDILDGDEEDVALMSIENGLLKDPK